MAAQIASPHAPSVAVATSEGTSQAEDGSRWRKYRLLLGVVPVISLLLIAPLTEWAMAQLTPAFPSPSPPPAEPLTTQSREECPCNKTSSKDDVPNTQADSTP